MSWPKKKTLCTEGRLPEIFQDVGIYNLKVLSYNQAIDDMTVELRNRLKYKNLNAAMECIVKDSWTSYDVINGIRDYLLEGLEE